MPGPTPNPDEPGSEPPARDRDDRYLVATGVDECAIAEGELLPRRPTAGRRGVLLVDRPNRLVYLLDADDRNRVFIGRARRPLAGDVENDTDYPADGTDHILRAAYEFEYDVIAAPWAGTVAAPDVAATEAGS